MAWREGHVRVVDVKYSLHFDQLEIVLERRVVRGVRGELFDRRVGHSDLALEALLLFFESV